MKDADVVVVGGGLAGLNSARLCVEGGASVVLLEARDRVGGRTVNRRAGKADFDLGGQWLGPGQDRVAALTKQLGISTFPTWNKGRKVMEVSGRLRTYDGTIPSLGLFDLLLLHRALGRVEKLCKQVPTDRPHEARRAAEWDSMSVESWKLANVPSRIARDTIDIAIRGVFGAEANELSLLHFLFYLNSGGGFMKLVEIAGGAQQDRFVGGAVRLSERMAASLGDRVVRSAPVEAIAQDGDGVTVTARGRTVRAKRAVVAVPPALAARIRFEPGLPVARDQLFQRFPMGALIKVIATYDRPFWRDQGFSGESVSTTSPVSMTFDNTTHDGSQPALVGFLGGNHARVWSARSAGDRRREVLEALGRFFGDPAREPTDVTELDWGAEEWSRGCPTGTMPPGTMTNLAPGLRDPVGRIHWAGTETATVWTGYMEGALQSGERASSEVLRAI